jgi:tRNA-specific 2-thiouridylase
MKTDTPIKALVMMSGGLDSMLAACVLKAQGIQITGLCFESPFFSAEKARIAAEHVGIPLIVENFSDDLIALVEHPKHGFGANINPCIDCHAGMIRRAGLILQRDGFHFVATGEVLNQRPMSQTRKNLDVVAEESGLKDRLLRPLSAKLLPETEPERLGWVDRARLLDLNGRGRKPQYKIAADFGLTHVPLSAGGCKLTEPNYADKVWDLRRNGQLKDRHAITLLRIGRHFRLSSKVKAIVGRDAPENSALTSNTEAGDTLLNTAPAIPGPTVLVSGPANEKELLMAAQLCARYSDVRTAPQVEIIATEFAGNRTLTVAPATDLDIDRLKI